MFDQIYCYNGIPRKRWFGISTIWDHDFVIISITTKMDSMGDLSYIVNSVCCRCDASRVEVLDRVELEEKFNSLSRLRLGEYRKFEAFLRSE